MVKLDISSSDIGFVYREYENPQCHNLCTFKTNHIEIKLGELFHFNDVCLVFYFRRKNMEGNINSYQLG